uniref:Omega-hydroxypalmitate O-feruloyl transferase n=1 Tax=Anthurium amnicola TaxID=1678845 RepID=A0A1D1YSS3_9ARAE
MCPSVCLVTMHETWNTPMLLSCDNDVMLSREKKSSEGAMEPEVTFLCKRTVVSNMAVRPGTYHHLSVLDRAMDQLGSVRAVYYYPRFPSAGGAWSTTGRLRESLAEVLTSYPAATGRLQRGAEGGWVVKCNDAGVRMVEARAKGSVQEWLQKVDREREMKLIFWEDIYDRPYFWSTFYVQLTEFEGGGLAIGMSCSHMLADATCLTMLVKAWAEMTLLGKMLSPPCFHPLPTTTPSDTSSHRRPYTDLIEHYRSSMEAENLGINPPRFNTATFAFSDEAVRSIVAESTAADDAAPTPFQALAALFWASITRVTGRKRGLIDMTICVDTREALNLSKSFFGNAMVFNGTQGGEIEEGRLDMAVKAIADVMKEMGHEGVLDLIEWLEAHSEATGPRRMLYGPRLLCANWEGLRPYQATFEPGVRPIQVSYYLEPVLGEGQILVLPSSQGNEGSLSRTVMVTLPEDQLGMLCEEAHVLRYHPKILLGPNKTHA